jgi:hypothetical protein
MLRTLAASLLVLASVAAQSSQGPFVGLPLHFTVGQNTLGPGAAPLSTNQLYLKRAGFHDLVTAPAYTTTRPEFTADAMYGALRPADFNVTAVSSGFCKVFCQFDASGQALLDVSSGAWGALLFSVSRMSPGGSTAAVAGEFNRPNGDGAGADVFSLVLPGSTLPPALAACVPIGMAQRANDSTEMGFQNNGGTQKPELGDFDPFFSFYEVEGSIAGYLVPDPWVYFTIDVPPPPVGLSAAMQLYVAPWFQMRSGTAVPAPANQISGASILRARWLSTATPPHWSTPELFLAYNELQLTQMDDQIDALSVDESGLIALSMRRTAARHLLGDQLMVAAFQWHSVAPPLPWPYASCTRTARPYKYDTTVDSIDPLAKLAGGENGGELDGICAVDPSNANGLAGVAFSYVINCRAGLGIPVPMAAAASPTLSGSSTTTRVAMSVAGVPNTLVGIGALLADIRNPAAPAGFNYPVTLDLWIVSSPLHTYDWNTPATVSGYGLELELQFLHIDITGALSLAVVIRVRV